MLQLPRSAHRPTIEDKLDCLVLRMASRSRIPGGILLSIGIVLGLIMVAAGFGRIGVGVVFLCGSFGLWLGASYRSVTFDVSQRRVFFATHYPPLFEKVQEGLLFEEVETVYLDYCEQAISDDYLAEKGIRRRWTIFFVLDDERIITIADEVTEYPARKLSVLTEQLAYWEDLANRICTAMGRPLVRTSYVPGPPHTFVEQIDQIVQRRLAQSQISGRSVHLRSQINGSLEIDADGKIYQDIHKVDDVFLRNLIQEAIDEWHDDFRAT